MSEPKEKPRKEYLGDSVYAECDGYYIWLTTNNGYPDDPRNKIALEPQVLEAFERYVTYLKEFYSDSDKGTET